jgi:hypothetical protein
VQSERLVDHQIKVQIANSDGLITVSLPNGQNLSWPIADKSIPSGVCYLTLSPYPSLPTKAELAKQVLQEILKPQL